MSEHDLELERIYHPENFEPVRDYSLSDLENLDESYDFQGE